MLWVSGEAAARVHCCRRVRDRQRSYGYSGAIVGKTSGILAFQTCAYNCTCVKGFIYSRRVSSVPAEGFLCPDNRFRMTWQQGVLIVSVFCCQCLGAEGHRESEPHQCALSQLWCLRDRITTSNVRAASCDDTVVVRTLSSPLSTQGFSTHVLSGSPGVMGPGCKQVCAITSINKSAMWYVWFAFDFTRVHVRNVNVH